MPTGSTRFNVIEFNFIENNENIDVSVSKKKLKYLKTNSIPRQIISVIANIIFFFELYFSISSAAKYEARVVNSIKNTYLAFHDI